jgi:hypothetical protein
MIVGPCRNKPQERYAYPGACLLKIYWRGKIRATEVVVYLFLAVFWLVVGVLIQVFWETLQPLARIPVDRTAMGFICFLLFSYSLVRWRMVRMLQRAREESNEPRRPRRRAEQPIDPTFDFSDRKPEDGNQV